MLPTPPALILQDILRESAAFENENVSAYTDDMDDAVSLGSDAAAKRAASELSTGAFPDAAASYQCLANGMWCWR
ncbi:uncharacterized protein ARMOST_15241 [Armillaria ostoyae]|uniref:Uncharacterized protein n=1 Tax=Armillaria ostoyae TaxID=47428 RepID=A0A284RSW7_ARMOS|nr:uncharacterized protein ARMOST_15241 [Armillaria ostoyae]